MTLTDEQIKAARDRLDWLRDEYGESDLDYWTFAPLFEELTKPEAEE